MLQNVIDSEGGALGMTDFQFRAMVGTIISIIGSAKDNQEAIKKVIQFTGVDPYKNPPPEE
ncbi:MAG: hypothetical protein LBS00_05900 [Synergistaceae bacterium]|jgi:hypothetical protein|nr:hypothetical protein [Synergistaceae bacterium]